MAYLKRQRFDYSIERDDESRTFFTNRIYLAETGDSFADMYLKNINDAKEYIDAYLIKFNGEEAKKILQTVLNRLVFNVYFVEDNFDVRVTFETMNNRGKRLSNLELLKNRLMYLSTFVGKKNVGSSNYENRLKNDINKAWKNIYKNLCYKDHQLNDDEYLQAHWIVYGSLDKSKGDTYIKDILNDKFSIDEGKFYTLIDQKDFANAFKHIDDYIQSLEKYSKFWGIINNPLERQNLITKNETLWLDRLNRIGSIKFVKSTIMVVAGDNYLTVDQKIQAYKLLERALFLNRLIGQSKNDFSAIIKNARELLKADETKKDQTYHELLVSIQSGEIAMGDDNLKLALEKFGLYLKEKNNYFYSWDGINYFLYEYNESLQILKSDEKIIDWNLINNDSIEHILPQTPSRKYWQIVLEPLNKNEDAIKSITNSLGNLLLLSKGDNSSVQNYSYPVKKSMDISSNRFAYIYGSRSAQKVAIEHEDWTLCDIYNREKELYQFLYERWIKAYSTLSENEFFQLIEDNGLSIGQQSNLSEEQIQRLHSLTFEDEQPEKKKELKTDKDWFIALRNYFNLERYSVKLNERQLSYLKDAFIFKRKNNDLICGILFENNKICYNYSFDSGILTINKNIDGEWINISEPSQFDKCTTYFISTLNRYLRRYYSKSEAIIYDESTMADDEEKAKSIHYSEDEFLEKRKDYIETINLYKKLKNLILEEFKNDDQLTQYFTNGYSAFCSKKNFVEIHIHKDSLRINMKDTGITSVLGGRLSENYKWPMMFQFTIKKEDELQEAMRLIKSSYQYIKN